MLGVLVYAVSPFERGHWVLFLSDSSLSEVSSAILVVALFYNWACDNSGIVAAKITQEDSESSKVTAAVEGNPCVGISLSH